MALITGGYNGASMKSAEIFNPVTKTSCSLPDLPEARNLHTQERDLACGGGNGNINTQKTCVKWNPASGTWTKSHTLREGSFRHMSWATSSGVYLIGGSAGTKSQKVKPDGSVEDGFVLKYPTRSQSAFYNHIIILYL